MALRIQVNAAEIAAQFKEFALEVEQDIKKGIENLSTLTHAQIQMNAQQELHSSRKIYMDNLNAPKEIVGGVWVITLDEDALWIEEGIKPNTDMKPNLLKNGKVSASTGNRYQVIPFHYSRPPSQNTPGTQNIVNQIKNKLRSEKVPFKKIEYNKDGSPKVGKLHAFDFGGKRPGRGNTPQMQGVSIYQTLTKTGNVRRDILTFRTVSSGPASQGKWVHPGHEGKKYMDKAFEEALKMWETSILPEIMQKWGK